MIARAALAPPDHAWLHHPSGHLALSPRNQRFTLDGTAGLIAYRERGRHWFAWGGVLAPEPLRARLLDAFIATAARQRRRVVAVQLRADQVALFRARGFTVNQLGSSYTLALDDFTLAGKARLKLRNKLKRARTMLRVVELGREHPADAAAFAALADVSAAWLGAKRAHELDFLVGELGQPGDPWRRVFAALDARGRVIAFITYVPSGSDGWLHDLTRRRPAAPPGALELCNATAIDRLRAEGARRLHFGFTPFLVDERREPGASRLLHAALRLLARWGRFLYPAQSQADYKRKWAPELVEREYVAARPLSLRAVVDLLSLTRAW